ncbi:nitrogen regulation protein NR(II) [endosymbiont of unidentified scaly snail isolate Monju]|uniref:nitrogen regulation protein NR(II) n=1 Tax=endosymbiont of unidentified scaly snail isolate Monju TaxID=1248727 RepID=UPI0003892D12|nr:nitrogen regulation protein NR(II) [endosymbiont of unidentified scaly snail isolate Monju]BAN68018.1 two-component system, NtrC family, nitrogen regulation sensor histidine kinase GlnL [endosymbiont of unidentified scaly snail isolate Monju]
MNAVPCPETRILDNLVTGVLVFDSEGRVLYLNQMAEAMLGLSARHVIGQRPEPHICCDGQPLIDLVGSAREGEVIGKRGATLVRADRELITVDCTITHAPEEPPRTIVELQQVDRQLRIRRENQLITQQAATRDLLRGLAHEIKNPLGGLRGAAQLLAAELPEPGLEEYTRIIIEEADRLKSLVDALLGPNRRPEYRPVNIHQVLERVRSLVLAEAGDRELVIERDYDPSIPELIGDADQLIQAVLNIVRNAVQALQGVERPRIRLKTRIARNFTIGAVRHRLVARVEIRDNGPGIPEAIADTLFLPMVTSGSGTGLGLSIAQSLITQHRGLVECSSRPGETVFTLLLPLPGNRNAQEA